MKHPLLSLLCLAMALLMSCSKDDEYIITYADDDPPQALITLIDDDTLNPDDIARFHSLCVENGIVATYACIADRGKKFPELFPLLHQYECEGFHVALHCYDQRPFYRSETHDDELIRNDISEAWKVLSSEGFKDIDYFVSPYGSKDRALQNIVRSMGFKCLVSISVPENLDNTCRYGRYEIPRFGFNAEDSPHHELSLLKKLIRLTAKTHGWLLVGTHIYNGWTQELLDTRFREFVDYAKGQNLRFVTLKDGFKLYQPVFEHFRK